MSLLEEEADDDKFSGDVGEALEEEDEIPDEEEEIKTDIEKIDARYDILQVNPRFTKMYSPDYVAFTLQLTSPVRRFVSLIYFGLQLVLTLIKSQGTHNTNSTYSVSHVRLSVDTYYSIITIISSKDSKNGTFCL